MSIIEFIGFIISMMFMGVMYLRRMKVERYRREHPEEFPEERHADDEEIEAYMRAYHLEEQARRAPAPPPHPTVQKKAPSMEVKRSQTTYRPLDKSVFPSSMAGYRQVSDNEAKAYEVERLHQNTRAQMLIKQLSSPQDLILLKEILGPPKALQKSVYDEPL